MTDGFKMLNVHEIANDIEPQIEITFPSEFVYCSFSLKICFNAYIF